MDNSQKIIMVLLVAAILFSVASIILNVSLVMSLDPSQFRYLESERTQDKSVSSSGEVSLYIIPSGGSE
jgi:hypothetical protein